MRLPASEKLEIIGQLPPAAVRRPSPASGRGPLPFALIRGISLS